MSRLDYPSLSEDERIPTELRLEGEMVLKELQDLTDSQKKHFWANLLFIAGTSIGGMKVLAMNGTDLIGVALLAMFLAIPVGVVGVSCITCMHKTDNINRFVRKNSSIICTLLEGKPEIIKDLPKNILKILRKNKIIEV